MTAQLIVRGLHLKQFGTVVIMIGFFTLLLIELFSTQGFFTWGITM